MTPIKYFTSQYFERWKAPSSCHQTDSPERKSAVRLEAFYIGEERSLCCAKKINTREREMEQGEKSIIFNTIDISMKY